MSLHPERHRSERYGWIRAVVLGADDGIVSTTSLLLGVLAASGSVPQALTAGVAGLVSGALSMATGEYVSVSTQSDAEAADIAREKHEQLTQPQHELEELVAIYRRRGLSEPLARQVAEALMKAEPLESHLRDELGLTEQMRARPLQAAVLSALSFAVGAGLPLAVLFGAPEAGRARVLTIAGLVLLTALGALGGYLGGAKPLRSMLRVFIGGGLAMLATALVGRWLDVAVS